MALQKFLTYRDGKDTAERIKAAYQRFCHDEGMRPAAIVVNVIELDAAREACAMLGLARVPVYVNAGCLCGEVWLEVAEKPRTQAGRLSDIADTCRCGRKKRCLL